jgi:hypothetical protein
MNSGFLSKYLGIKQPLVLVISKPFKNLQFYERTNKEPAFFWPAI